MKVKMELLSDTVFGNGISIPGGEDISVLHDTQGFPYYKGGTLKGIFREEMQRYLSWTGKDEAEIASVTKKLLGEGGSNEIDHNKLVFSNFEIPASVKSAVLYEIENNPDEVFEAFTNLRTFTAIDDSGVVKQGSLRVARCVNQGITYEGTIRCNKEDEDLVKDVLGMIKYIGSMRNRGFGKVKFTVEAE